jgi:hypothetical protein
MGAAQSGQARLTQRRATPATPATPDLTSGNTSRPGPPPRQRAATPAGDMEVPAKT